MNNIINQSNPYDDLISRDSFAADLQRIVDKMQRFDIAGVLLLLVILPLITSAIDLALLVPNKKDCTMERVQRLVAYNCNNLKYKEVPQNLQSGAEVRLIQLFFNFNQ